MECSSSAASDALDRLDAGGGVVDGLVCVASDVGVVIGRARTATVVASEEPGMPGLAEFLDGTVAGDVLVLGWEGPSDVSTFGGLASARLVGRGGRALVVDGWVRDRDDIRTQGLTVWAKGTTPRSGKGRIGVSRIGEPTLVGGVTVSAGDRVVADSTGVVVLGQETAQDVLNHAAELESLDRSFADHLRSGSSFGSAYEITGIM